MRAVKSCPRPIPAAMGSSDTPIPSSSTDARICPGVAPTDRNMPSCLILDLADMAKALCIMSTKAAAASNTSVA